MKRISFALIVLVSSSAIAQQLDIAGQPARRSGDRGAAQCPVRPGDASARAAYDALTPTEIASIKARYEGMAENDEPPFPVDGMAKIDQELNLAVGKVEEDTQVDITVDIDADGVPQTVSIYGRDGGQVAKYMAGYLMRQKYKPALCNCAPCKQAFWYWRSVTLRPIK